MRAHDGDDHRRLMAEQAIEEVMERIRGLMIHTPASDANRRTSIRLMLDGLVDAQSRGFIPSHIGFEVSIDDASWKAGNALISLGAEFERWLRGKPAVKPVEPVVQEPAKTCGHVSYSTLCVDHADGSSVEWCMICGAQRRYNTRRHLTTPWVLPQNAVEKK